MTDPRSGVIVVHTMMPPFPARPRRRRWFVRGLWVVALVAGVYAAAVFFLQDKFVWHPRGYPAGRVEAFPRALTALDFRTAQGRQTAFYLPARNGRPLPAVLCVLFAGNGSLALDWEQVVMADTARDRAYLLVDYPGYGRCEGNPSPAAIAQNADGAMDALARRVALPDGPALEKFVADNGRLEAAAHSMGTAVALEFAARHPAVGRVALVAPFSSMLAMAKRVVPWPFYLELRCRFDNRARLDELAGRAVRPQVLILHGERDSLIPPAMGRGLAVAHPDFVRFEPVNNANHDDVVAKSLPRLLAFLDGR